MTHARCNMILTIVIFIAASSVPDVLMDDFTCQITHSSATPVNELRCALPGDIPPATVKSLTWSWLGTSIGEARNVQTKTCNVTSFVPLDFCQSLSFKTNFASHVNCTIYTFRRRVTCTVRYVAPTVTMNVTLRPMPLIGGERVVLRCKATGWPRPTITWFINGSHMNDDNRLKIRLKTQKTVDTKTQVVDLEVMNVTVKYRGEYKCVAVNIAGKKSRREWTFVSCPLDPFRCGIQRTSPMVLIVQNGGNVTLSCSAEFPEDVDDPFWAPKIGDHLKGSKDEFNCYSTRLTGTIYNVSEVDRGIYTCSIRCKKDDELEILRNSSIYVFLDSQGPFYRLLVRQATVSVMQRSDAELECEIKSLDPLLEYVRTFWKFNGTTIESDGHHYNLSWQSGPNRRIITMKIHNVSQYDAGLYNCGMDGFITNETLLKNILLDVTLGLRSEKENEKPSNMVLSILLPVLVGCAATVGFVALLLYQISKIWNMTARKNDCEETQMEAFESDVFVTYSNKDFDWVDNELIPVLEENQVKYIIHSRDFELGKPIVENMADSIYTSRKIIVVLSRNYISSRFCLAELGMALRRNKDQDDNSIVAIRLEKLKRDEIPKDLKRITFLDYADKEEREFWRSRLMKQLIRSVPMIEANGFDTLL